MSQQDEGSGIRPEGFEDKVEQAVKDALTGMKPDEQSELSKVLFPETHTAKVTLCGKEREVFPLPLKYARKVNDVLLPVAEKIQASTMSEATQHVTEDIISGLSTVVICVAEFRGWEDVRKAAEDEMIPLSEMQALAVEQVHVQGANDFLLGVLRIVIRVMQIQEIVQIRFQSLCTSQGFVKPGDVPLKRSSHAIPTDSSS